MVKGMAVYSVIWPTSSCIQQIVNKEEFDWKKSFRFFLFGTFFVAPTLYGWVKLTSHMWPQMNLKSGITKAAVEQVSYGPMAGVSFFTIMSLLEGKNFKEACKEVKDKFPSTFQGKFIFKIKISCNPLFLAVGVCFWPLVQVINFTFIKERNRVSFVAMGSFVWTIFLAYMKQLDAEKLKKENEMQSTTISSSH